MVQNRPYAAVTRLRNYVPAPGSSKQAAALMTLAQLQDRFPHWLRPGAQRPPDLDQHALLALASPRAVYLAAAEDDLWADPMGSYMALVAASRAWLGADGSIWPDPAQVWTSKRQITNGPLGFHLRTGGHALLPYDWRQFLAFLARVP